MNEFFALIITLFLMVPSCKGQTDPRNSFHTICTTLVNENVDPVVSYGKVGVGHAHRIVGANGFNSHSTAINPSNFSNDPATSIFKSSTGTTCDIALDLSAYWQPILYYQLSSNLNLLPVLDGPAKIYYNFYAGVQNFPDDFKVIVGKPSRTVSSGDPDNPAVFFEYPVGTKLYDFPAVSSTCGTKTELRAHVFFPNCGKVDPATGKLLRDPVTGRYILGYPIGFRSGAEIPKKGGFSYRGQGCPVGDIVFPQIHQAFHYSLKNICPGGQLMPGRFVWSNGNFDGRGLHADFLNGWDPQLMNNIIAQCLASQCTGNGNGCPANICVKAPQPAYTLKEDTLDYDGPVTGIPPLYYNQNYWGFNPVRLPSIDPSNAPSLAPTSLPSRNPSDFPSVEPSFSPSDIPSVEPSFSPSDIPSVEPSIFPSDIPSLEPSIFPSDIPSLEPSIVPSNIPSCEPTISFAPSSFPSFTPSVKPSIVPSNVPSIEPTMSFQPSIAPSVSPSFEPTISNLPSMLPSFEPTFIPSSIPSVEPTISNAPSIVPSATPSVEPSTDPSVTPSVEPSENPSVTPSIPPTYNPSTQPTYNPSKIPSAAPSIHPTAIPTLKPSAPSVIPTKAPISPSRVPTKAPLSKRPTKAPLSKRPTKAPLSKAPTKAPSFSPTVAVIGLTIKHAQNSPSNNSKAKIGTITIAVIVSICLLICCVSFSLQLYRKRLLKQYEAYFQSNKMDSIDRLYSDDGKEYQMYSNPYHGNQSDDA